MTCAHELVSNYCRLRSVHFELSVWTVCVPIHQVPIIPIWRMILVSHVGAELQGFLRFESVKRSGINLGSSGKSYNGSFKDEIQLERKSTA